MQAEALAHLVAKSGDPDGSSYDLTLSLHHEHQQQPLMLHFLYEGRHIAKMLFHRCMTLETKALPSITVYTILGS